jgi:hypothetical protein
MNNEASKQQILDNVINSKIINYLSIKKFPKHLEFRSSSELELVDQSEIETHPDIIDLLWREYSKKIPSSCQMILFGTPVLVNPKTGIIFGIAEGTNPPILRVRPEVIPLIIKNGGKVLLSNMDGVFADANILGDDWIYCFSFINEIQKYCIESYEYSFFQPSSGS